MSFHGAYHSWYDNLDMDYKYKAMEWVAYYVDVAILVNPYSILTNWQKFYRSKHLGFIIIDTIGSLCQKMEIVRDFLFQSDKISTSRFKLKKSFIKQRQKYRYNYALQK